jgi:hypothetical protein
MDPTPPGTESASRVVHQELYAALFVTVGTDSKYRFDRLIDWVDEWLQKRGEVMPSTLVQHGTSRPARFARSQDFLEHDEIVAAIEGASLVITHGGPATMFECWRSRKRPVVVALEGARGSGRRPSGALRLRRMGADADLGCTDEGRVSWLVVSHRT